MPTLEFVGQSARDSDAAFAQSSRLVNLYREPIAATGQAGHILKSVLGMDAILSDTGDVLVYALQTMGGALYAVANDRLYEVSTSLSLTDRGAIVVGEDCSMSSNNGVLTIAGGGRYYTWDGSSVAQPTAGAFSSFGSVDFLGNYTLLTESGGRRLQWSDLGDASTLDALNFATAEGTDEDIVRGVVINGYWWVFKTSGHEIWGLTGQGGVSAFARVGEPRDIGLLGAKLVTRIDGGGFLVGNEGICYLVAGADLRPVSIPAVETAIKAETPAQVFYYEDEGHKFCVVRFSNRAAWVFDLATGEWHERAEGAAFGAWQATSAVNFNGAWQVGRRDGTIRTLSRSNADGDTALTRTAISRTLYLGDREFSVPEIQIRGAAGAPGQAKDAECWIRVSRDNGRTWSGQKHKTLGGTGDYGARAIWRRLGNARQFTVEWSMSDPIEWPILADARYEVVMA